MINQEKQIKEPQNIIESINNELKYFKHFIQSSVQFYEVDSANVVHNIRYLYWLEAARIAYFQDIGIEMNKYTFIKNFPVMVVHNEIDYFNPSYFNDIYQVHSRITSIGNSSFNFSNIILTGKKPLARAKSILVYIDPKEHLPCRIPETFRQKLKIFEGDDINIVE